MTLADLRGYLAQPNVAAFLRVIREKESGQTDAAYFMRWPGKTFTDLSAHPNILEPIPGSTLKSSAAGAYQITGTTWRGLQAQYGFADFSRASQDMACVALIAGRGALQDVLAGRFNEAVARCRPEWTSLPGAAESSASWTMGKARAVYVQYGGTFTLHEQPAKVNESAPPKLNQRKAGMDPLTLISVFGPLIGQLIPQVSKVFGGGERAQANVAVAQTVLDAVVKASGQPNVQAAVEAMQADPVLTKSVTAAVVTDPEIVGLLEIGGGIKAAREADAAAVATGKPFWQSPALVISCLLLAMPFMLLADIFYVHPASYEGNLRTQIVTAVLVIISMVGAFYLGSSQGSQKKDEAMIARDTK